MFFTILYRNRNVSLNRTGAETRYVGAVTIEQRKKIEKFGAKKYWS